MLLLELFNDITLDSVLIPVTQGSRARVEVPRFVYALAGPAGGRRGIPARPVQAEHRGRLSDLYGRDATEQVHVWLSIRPYRDLCWRVDLAACDGDAVRLYDSDKGYLIHRGDLPPGAVSRGLGLPPLMGGRHSR
jgi:hypothetical protein